MNILIVSNYYPPFETGGYEQLCRDVAGQLTRRGHRTVVLTSNQRVGQRKSSDERDVYRVLRIQPTIDSHLNIAVQYFLTRRYLEARNRTVFQRVAKIVEPDVVFVWNLQGLPQELALDAEALPHSATAYWLAGYTPAEPDLYWRYWTQPPSKNLVLRNLKSFISHLACAQMRSEGKPVRPQMRHVAVVSEYMRCRGLVEGTLPANAVVIYNGVETELFYRPVPAETPMSPVNLLLAGRVSPDKGIHVAIEAIGKLIQARPQRDFRLLIAGSGPLGYREHLDRLALRYHVADLVCFLGALPRDKMPELMHDCHILLLPTVHQEPFARVTLEAMAAGLAVIGTMTGGTGEILQEGVTGLVCEAGDSTGLSYQIGRLLDDSQFRRQLAAHGQEIVLANYTLVQMVDRLEAMLERSIAERIHPMA